MSEVVVEKKKGKKGKIIDWIVTGVFLLLFAFVGISQIDGMSHQKENFGETLRFGWGTFVVATDSMEPEYKVKSAIITYKESAETIYKRFNAKADAKIDITFADRERVNNFTPTSASLDNPTTPTGEIMTHRLREIHIDESKAKGEGRYIFVVSGINTEGHLAEQGQYQTFTERYIIGVVKGNSKVLGGFFNFIGSVWGLLVLLLIPAGYMVIASVLDMFKAIKDDEPETAGAIATSSNVELDNLSSKEKERLKQELLEQIIEKKKQEKLQEASKETKEGE